MTENKRFIIQKSNMGVGYVIIDGLQQYTFPVLTKEECISICKTLNRQDNEIDQLETENHMLRVTIRRNESYINKITGGGEWKTI